MYRSKACAAFALGFSVDASSSSHAWFTLTGNPHGARASDYVQVDPTALTSQGWLKLLPFRVNRAAPTTSEDGIAHRSMTGLAAIDCETQSARYVRVTYFAETGFSGATITQQLSYLNRTLVLRTTNGDPLPLIIKAACRT